MAITIISKKKLAFRNPDIAGEEDKFFTVEPGIMVSAPEWVAADPMYKWGKTTGTITAMEHQITVGADPDPALDKKTKAKKADAPAADEKGTEAK